MNTVTLYKTELQYLEGKVSDLVCNISIIRSIARANRKSVDALLISVEMALQSVQDDLCKLRTIRQA